MVNHGKGIDGAADVGLGFIRAVYCGFVERYHIEGLGFVLEFSQMV